MSFDEPKEVDVEKLADSLAGGPYTGGSSSILPGMLGFTGRALPATSGVASTALQQATLSAVTTPEYPINPFKRGNEGSPGLQTPGEAE